MQSNLKKLVTAALFAALACVATMSIRIPTPGTNGYIHPGDALVILAGVFLGPAWGLLAAGMYRSHLSSRERSRVWQDSCIETSAERQKAVMCR